MAAKHHRQKTTSKPVSPGDVETLRALSVPVVADLLNVSPITVRRLISAGRLESFRVGDRVLVTAGALRRFIDSAVVR